MAHFLRDSSVRQRSEPVQDSTRPWVPDSRPLRGPDSSWTEPARRRQGNALLAKEMSRYELALGDKRVPKVPSDSSSGRAGLQVGPCRGAMARAPIGLNTPRA